MSARRILLAVGLVLHLSLAGAQTAAATADLDWRYNVQPGDTLITLTEAWLAPPRGWRDLQKLNRLADPQRLKPGSTLRMPVAWLRREASVAETLFVKGEVTRQRGSVTEPLAAGATLQSGDRLRTGAQASTSLRFADGSRLLIPPQSEVVLEQLLVLGRGALPSVRLGVIKGGADSQVAPNAQRVPLYEVQTPHVNLGVRGTQFRVQTAAGATRMSVLEGALHADGLSADVAAGQGLLAEGTARAVTPLLAAPDLSAMPPLAERLPMQFRWPATPVGAVAWRAQLFERFVPGAVERLLLDARVDAPTAAWPEAGEVLDGDYTLRVRGIDARGLEGAATDLAVQLRARPEPPFIQSPAPGAVSYTGGVALSWSRNTAAPRVRLQIARDAGFQDLVLQPPPLDAASFDAKLPDGLYHVRVGSVEASGRAGPFGDSQTVEIKPPPPSPPPAEPEASDAGLTLRWRGDPSVTRYELEWARTAAFDTPDVQRFKTEQPVLVIPKPSPGTYFLRSRAFNAAGAASPWSQPQMIEQPYPRWLWLLPLLLVPLL